MIHPEKGLHSNHPGHDNSGCHLRLQINAALYGTSRNGYACSYTGGHCIKTEACAGRVAEDKQHQEKFAPELAELEQHRIQKEHFNASHFD